MTGLAPIVAAVFAAILLGAAISDAWRYRIANFYPLFVIGLFAAAWWLGFPFDATLWSHLLHFSAALLAGMLLFHFRWFGGGDAKLYAAIALWFGIGDAVFLLFTTTMSGAVILLIRILFHILRGFTGSAVEAPTGRKALLARKIPYGIAIATGGIVSLFWIYM